MFVRVATAATRQPACLRPQHSRKLFLKRGSRTGAGRHEPVPALGQIVRRCRHRLDSLVECRRGHRRRPRDHGFRQNTGLRGAHQRPGLLSDPGREKPSVVQIRASNLNPAAIGARVIYAIRQLSDALESGALITIEPGRTRARLLPLTVTAPSPQTFDETPTTVKD